MTGHVEVALPLPVFRTFTYRVDVAPPPPGTRVLVPFRRSEQVGWVVRETDPSTLESIRGTIRPLLDVLERSPSIPPDLLQLAEWISGYYVAPIGIVFRSMLPAVLSDGSREVLRPTSLGQRAGDAGASLPPRAAEVLAAVRERGGEIGVKGLRRALGLRSIWPEIRRLTAEGYLEHETRPPPDPPVKTRKVVRIVEWVPDLAAREEWFGRAGRQRACYELLEASGGALELDALQKSKGFSRSVVTGLERKGLAVVEDQEVLRDPFRDGERADAVDFSPTPAQAGAIEKLRAGVNAPAPTPFLLHGVTGSGKTLVYIHLLREVVEPLGRSAIVLVPEISLTPQTVERFRAWFGDEVAVLHSALSAGERFDQWRQLRRGDKRVVVGARSALFAPVSNLGVIVVDEEHDGSYKQSDAPRYHARDVAVVRAKLAGAVCVLGTATPSLESWLNVERGKFQLLELPERVGGRRLPPVEIVDLRKARSETAPASSARSAGPGPHGRGKEGEGEGILSSRLVSAVRERLGRSEQSILLLNRRGYASFVQCRACGAVKECPNCSVSLTFHRAHRRLVCHHCRHEEPAPERCHACGDRDLWFGGLGTEQVERVVAGTFPGARIARMDVDTTSGKWSHHEILGRVQRGEVDILLGTQMIAKGLDFPRVTLVGVVNADVGIHLPDFRAAERAFQLLSQVAGRTGRGDLGGEVVIQTRLPEHHSVQCALSHDVREFNRRELEDRRDPPYPPHVRLVNVIASSPDPELAVDAVEGAAKWIRARVRRGEAQGVELVGPARSPIERLHGRWRWHFFLRGGRVSAVTVLLRRFLEDHRPPGGDVRIAVDRDPIALL